MHHRGECGYRGICLAFPNERSWNANGKQSHLDGRVGEHRREASSGDDRAEEWILLCAGSQDGQASFGEATGENGLGSGGYFENWRGGGDSEVGGGRRPREG